MQGMSETKDRILKVGIDILSKKGYNNVGLKEILALANVPKGSFYHYFKSKEDFGIQVISKYSSVGLCFFKQYLEDESLSPKSRIISFYKAMIEHYQQKNCSEGCLIGNASNELSDLTQNFSKAISQEFMLWQNHLEKCIVAAQESGEISSDSDSRMLASFILNSWEGALLRMKCQKNVSPLNDFIEGLMMILK